MNDAKKPAECGRGGLQEKMVWLGKSNRSEDKSPEHKEQYKTCQTLAAAELQAAHAASIDASRYWRSGLLQRGDTRLQQLALASHYCRRAQQLGVLAGSGQ